MKVRYSAAAWRVFDAVFKPWMNLHIDRVRISGLENALDVPRDRPLLVCPNHVSWWDGFLIRAVHRRLRPEAPLYSIMLESELKSRPLLRWLGGLGVTPGSVGSLRALLRTVKRLSIERPDAVFVLFPQGRIYPSHRRPLGFLPGVTAVAEALHAPAWVLPASIHLEAGANPAPTALLHLGTALPTDRVAPEEMQDRVEAGIDRILDFLALFGEDAADLWPDDLTTAHPTERRSPATPGTSERELTP